MSAPPAQAYVSSVEEILWGITLVALTLAVHGFGMLLTVRASNAVKHSGRARCPVSAPPTTAP